MANYAASVLAEAQLILAERFAAPEKRLKSPGVFGAFRKNTDIAIPNVGSLRTKEERPENGYFFNRAKRSVITSRTYDHTGTVADSTEVAFSWATYGDKAQTSLKRSDNNVFADAQILANELENMFKNIYEGIDGAALTYLGTNKTTVNGATKNGVFDATNDVFEIATANIARFIQHGKSMLRQNYYSGSADAILDPALFLEAEHYLNQGSGNSVNTAYQASLGAQIWEAIGLSDANYPIGAGYFVPEGTIGVVDWIPRQNREGKGDFDSVLGGYGSIVDPISGLTFAVHSYAQRADTSASGGDTQDEVQEWEISVDLSFNKAPLTAAGETTIFEVGIIDTPA
ncbi:hypothetical protein [Flagellimonas flava]|uniref:hypothetical protein n=1 Tax=Flagellimonas flava TaxID=570519 RepID=UPI003D64E9D9